MAAAVEYPLEVRLLVQSLKTLPGIGPRGAERIALWLLTDGRRQAEQIGRSVESALQVVRSCSECGFFATSDRCVFCEDSGRDAALLCVVEKATDILPLERTGILGGRYHVLGGKLSPLDHVGPDDLKIAELLRRVREGVREVVLALGSDVEGEATAHYLAGELRACGARVTRLAQGLPAGGGLEHADPLTLTRALARRDEV